MTRFSSWIISLAVLSAFTICSTYSAPLKGAKASDSKAILDSCIYGVGNNGDTGKAECLKGPGESCESGHRCANGLICRDDLGESSKAVCVVDPKDSSHTRKKRQTIQDYNAPPTTLQEFPNDNGSQLQYEQQPNDQTNEIPVTNNIPTLQYNPYSQINQRPNDQTNEIPVNNNIQPLQYNPYSQIDQQPLNYNMIPMSNNQYNSPYLLHMYKLQLDNYIKKLHHMQKLQNARLRAMQAKQHSHLTNLANPSRNIYNGGLMPQQVLPSPNASPLTQFPQQPLNPNLYA